MKTALIVDDSKIMLEILYAELASEDMIVVPVESGREALAWLQTNRADVVTTDINMPEMDGFAFLAEMKRQCGAACPPFLVVSSEERRGRPQEAVASDAVGWVTKPFAFGSLSALIARHLAMVAANDYGPDVPPAAYRA